MKMASIVFCAATLVGVAACGASKSLKDEDRKAIKTVYLRPSVALPAEPKVRTRGAAIGTAIGGSIGAAVASGATSQEAAVRDYLKTYSINVGELLATSLASEIAKRGVFQLSSSEATADAQISLDVLSYGISHNGMAFSDQYRVYMRAKGTMVRPDGGVVWAEELGDGPMNGDRPQTTLEDLFKDPETLRQHMTLLAQSVSKTMAASLSNSK